MLVEQVEECHFLDRFIRDLVASSRGLGYGARECKSEGRSAVVRLIRTRPSDCISSGVAHSGSVVEVVLTGIPQGESHPVAGGVTPEIVEIFRQLDEILLAEDLSRLHICSGRVYLADVGQVEAVDVEWRRYFEDHAPNRRCYGVALQLGMQVEAAFVIEVEPGPVAIPRDGTTVA